MRSREIRVPMKQKHNLFEWRREELHGTFTDETEVFVLVVIRLDDCSEEINLTLSYLPGYLVRPSWGLQLKRLWVLVE